MSNLSRHIRQVHNNESTECPDCGKALTISNLNKHIKSVHKKLKKTCDICNEEVPYSSIRFVVGFTLYFTLNVQNNQLFQCSQEEGSQHWQAY